MKNQKNALTKHDLITVHRIVILILVITLVSLSSIMFFSKLPEVQGGIDSLSYDMEMLRGKIQREFPDGVARVTPPETETEGRESDALWTSNQWQAAYLNADIEVSWATKESGILCIRIGDQIQNVTVVEAFSTFSRYFPHKRVLDAIFELEGFDILEFYPSDQSEEMTAEEVATYYKNNPFIIPVTPWGNEFSYVIYGEFISLSRLRGSDHGVVCVMPLNEGGERDESYGSRTYYVPKEVLDTIEGETQIDENGVEGWRKIDGAFKIEVTNNDDAGGFIDLPSIILSAERIDAKDIPFWAGA